LEVLPVRRPAEQLVLDDVDGMRHLVVIRLVELRELEEFASQQRGQLPALGLLLGEPNRNHPFTISHIPPLVR
jgi:hypothetical protein